MNKWSINFKITSPPGTEFEEGGLNKENEDPICPEQGVETEEDLRRNDNSSEIQRIKKGEKKKKTRTKWPYLYIKQCAAIVESCLVQLSIAA